MSSSYIHENSNIDLNEIKPNRENIRIIYLNKSETEFDIQLNLLKINPATLFYTDIKLCLDLIKASSNEKFFLIISNTLLSKIFDSIYFLRPIIAIFVYDDNKEDTNQSNFAYPKIIDRYTDLNELCKSIQEKIQFIEKQAFIYCLFNENDQPALLHWYNMLIDILKQIPENKYERDEILDQFSEYYRMNQYESDRIELFRKHLKNQHVIQWYTNECFLYKILNRALQTLDFDILYLLRFYLTDLFVEIEKQYENIKHEKYLIAYRAQIMSMEEIERLKKSIGYSISINSFLCASRKKTDSLLMLKKTFSIYENVLFEIHVDLSVETIILTDIFSFNSIPCEKQILFNMNSIFKIDSIEYDTINNIWNVKMIPHSNGRKQLNEYLIRIQQETDYPSSIMYFGHLLWKELNQMKQAKNYFNILLKLLPDDDFNLSNIYIELGNINDRMKKYNCALDDYQMALKIYQKQISQKNIHMAELLNSIGMVYQHMNDFDRAIDYYQQSLSIYENICSTDDKSIHRTSTMVNLGLTYRDKKDYDTALSYLIQVYNIRRTILPNDHRLIVNILIEIADIYHDKHEFDQALNYYQQYLSIEETIYSISHLNKSNTIRNIGLVYYHKKDWQNALNYFNRTLKIRQNLLFITNHANYLDVAICYGDIGNVYDKMNNLDLAFNYYYQQYNIEEQYLSLNHHKLIEDFDRIIHILKKQYKIERALELCQEKLLILKNILNNEYESNSCVAHILVLIANIHEDKDPREAHQYYQHAFEIFEQNRNEEIFQFCLSTMINFYWKCRMFNHALICQMKLLHLQRLKSASSNNRDIAYSLRDLARIYRSMDKSNEALKYFDQSLNILKKYYGSEHVDVKHIQKEIFDLKDIIKSLASDADEDYNNRRSSNAHKELFIIPTEDSISRSSTLTCDKRKKSSTSDIASAICIIL